MSYPKYTGEKPQPMRPGSEVAQTIPSLRNGVRIPHKPAAPMCVGAKAFVGTSK